MVDERDAATMAASPPGAIGQADGAHSAAGGGVGAVQDAGKTLGAASAPASPPNGLGAPPVERVAGAASRGGSGRRDGVEGVPGERLVAGSREGRI